MKNFYIEFINKLMKDFRFKDMELSFTEDRRKYYKEGKVFELKILRVALKVDVKNGLFLKTYGFRVNHIVEDNLTELVIDNGYTKKKIKGLNYSIISSMMFEKSTKDINRRDLSTTLVL
ncbi:hypothetical protein NNC19_20240 [Clostridium sp. SHJSY1]|uniref:hypothetical protein n=1 Tax=Clostridium sp. SHJSY1 TaxID=2942483 RepID=UPI002876F387|nr:hypothetical protein [Clostridium sp. SHJSY1]MDS0528028.1 hypothetical protein [Clostridium sp. SHJSY1]